MCQGDNDSDNDLRALQYYLGRKLHQEELSLYENTESETECTLRELNIAHLTINVSSDTSGNAVANNSGVTGHQCCEEESLYSEMSACESSAVNTRRNTVSSKSSSAKLYEKEFFYSCYCNERSELCLGQADGDVTASDNYKPELCTTLHLVKCPKKEKMFKNMVYEESPSLRKELFKHCDNHELSTSDISSNSESPNNLEKELVHQDEISHTATSPSSLKLTNAETVQSLANTCPSLLSIAEEFLYKDTEAGIQFIERRCPTVAVLSR